MLKSPQSAYSKKPELVKQLFEISGTTYFLTPFGGFFTLIVVLGIILKLPTGFL